jgi:hypothetical protein
MFSRKETDLDNVVPTINEKDNVSDFNETDESATSELDIAGVTN